MSRWLYQLSYRPVQTEQHGVLTVLLIVLAYLGKRGENVNLYFRVGIFTVISLRLKTLSAYPHAPGGAKYARPCFQWT